MAAPVVKFKNKPSKKTQEKEKATLNQEQKDVMVGVSLGDASLEYPAGYRNCRVRFDQTYPSHAFYIIHLYNLFVSFVGTGPKITVRAASTVTGNIYSSISFKTLGYPCFNVYYQLFYV